MGILHFRSTKIVWRIVHIINYKYLMREAPTEEEEGIESCYIWLMQGSEWRCDRPLDENCQPCKPAIWIQMQVCLCKYSLNLRNSNDYMIKRDTATYSETKYTLNLDRSPLSRSTIATYTNFLRWPRYPWGIGGLVLRTHHFGRWSCRCTKEWLWISKFTPLWSLTAAH